MGKVLSISIALMIIFFVVTLLGYSAYNFSTDTTKTQYYSNDSFKSYTVYKNQNYTDLNVSYATTNSTISTFEIIGLSIAKDIATAQQTVETGNVLEKVAAAFGLVAALGLQILAILVTVVIEGINLIFGIGNNLSLMPVPFSYLGILVNLMIPIFIVYLVFKLAGAVKGWDI